MSGPRECNQLGIYKVRIEESGIKLRRRAEERMSFSGTMLMGVIALAMGRASSSFVPEPRLLSTLSCGSHTMKPGERVAIQSPNFPSNYKINDRCQYEITCQPMESTSLEFICPSFQLESSSDCSADRFILASRGNRVVKCGSNSPDGTKTSDGWSRITFFSNGQKTAKGFRCYVWCRAQTTTPSTTTDATTTTPTTTTATTTGTTTTGTTTAATTGTTTTEATTTGTTTAGTTTTGASTTAASTTTANCAR
ncbi:protein SpAN-like [Macrobrachium nipponense]|uniref:protein SpAN-like n=1 Tax=Macrobrachium nipponense TaxID=159736 RepID=UPI0030C85A2F